MSTYIFALISLLLLIPIVYFLPLGMTLKGKIITISASLLFALMGVAAQASFLWWQIILLMLALVLAAAYFMGSRMPNALFSADTAAETAKDSFTGFSYPHEESAGMETELDLETPAEAEAVVQAAPDYTMEIEQVIEEAGEQDEAADFVGGMEEEDLEDLFSGRNPESAVELEELSASTDISSDEEEELALYDSSLQDDEEIEPFLEFGLSGVDEEDEESRIGESDLHVPVYMADLEKLMLEETDLPGEKDSEEINDITLVHPEETPVVEESVIPIGTGDNIEEIYEINRQAEAELLFESEEYSNEVAIRNDEDLPQEDNGPVLTNIEKLDSALENSDSQYDNFEPEEMNDSGTNEQAMLQHQLLHNLLAQLQAAKRVLGQTQYEEMVRGCLSPNLPLSDYYTFASLLIKHYAAAKEYQKLQLLLGDLEAKYKDYPIILQEIHFLQKIYLSK
ncbi:hypothetical protein [Bacillus infantis]|uniref:hypothetical protein n=1 Tax=Bacillus infantis TaxID=324767 RepID=UPI0021554168|nr:hypothetical protein [Bacillus infantis]MCR6612176.1 hypothetical protein [Bacillus infantis]